MDWAQALFATSPDMGCLAHVLKGKMTKLETRSEVCYFIGYPQGTYGWYFYDPREQKVFLSTNIVSWRMIIL